VVAVRAVALGAGRPPSDAAAAVRAQRYREHQRLDTRDRDRAGVDRLWAAEDRDQAAADRADIRAMTRDDPRDAEPDD
jgi:hypothetical protein